MKARLAVSSAAMAGASSGVIRRVRTPTSCRGHGQRGDDAAVVAAGDAVDLQVAYADPLVGEHMVERDRRDPAAGVRAPRAGPGPSRGGPPGPGTPPDPPPGTR